MTALRRLLVEVEGHTEEQLVKEVLAPHLFAQGYEIVGARLLGNQRPRARRGGIRNWDIASRDILQHLREDTGRVVTTLVDYYALPATGKAPWPGRAEAAVLPVATSAARQRTWKRLFSKTSRTGWAPTSTGGGSSPL